MTDNNIISCNVGIDASMNFTGVTFVYTHADGTRTHEFIAVTAFSEKVAYWITQKCYKRIIDTDTYSSEEMHKVISAKRQASVINKLINERIERHSLESIDARMEGSLVNTGRFKQKQVRINDLTMFNSIIKLMLISNANIRAIGIIAPKRLKKLATGNGNASKEKMVEHFFTKCRPDLKRIPKMKVDDVIDAFYLANCEYSDDKCFVK